MISLWGVHFRVEADQSNQLSLDDDDDGGDGTERGLIERTQRRKIRLIRWAEG